MRLRLDVEQTLREIGQAFEVAPPDVKTSSSAVADEIYEEYFAGRVSVGEFLCVLVFLLYKAANEIAWAKETLP